MACSRLNFPFILSNEFVHTPSIQVLVVFGPHGGIFSVEVREYLKLVLNKAVHSAVAEMVCERMQCCVLVPTIRRKLLPSSASYALKVEVLLLSETLVRT
jgi:riboflavin transporter FmnP